MEKKVLIVTYYWPPAGGPGVQRWVKFCHYLSDFDINPIIYTPKNPSYPLLDKTIGNQVSKKIEIIKQPILEPYKWANHFTKKNEAHHTGFYQKKEDQHWKTKVSLFVRGNFFIPDARKFWIRPSINFLKKYIKEQNVDTIITTGPPHSMHLIGKGVKKVFPKLKWIADFRDPWTNVYYYQSLRLTRRADQKHKKLELQVLNRADYVITTTREYQSLYQGKTRTPVHCLTNGFDPVDFSESTNAIDKNFSIVYTGTMFKERNPKILWKILKELSLENSDFAEDLSVKLIGKIDNSVLQDIHACQLNEKLNLTGYLTHKQVIKEQQSASVLLLVTADQSARKGNLPGKLFEYMGAQRPIIAFGPSDSEIEKILNETATGTHFLFNDKTALKNHFLQLYKQYKSKKLTVNSKKTIQYHRRNITRKLSEIIKE